MLKGPERETQGAAEEVKPLSRSRKSASKREAIIRVAIDIINRKSFALASMSEIAASLDLRDAALYYYFPGKQALVYACHVRSLERFERLLDDADGLGGTGAEKLERFVSAMLNDSSQNGPQLYFGDHSYLDETQREAVDGWADRLKAKVEMFLKEGIADGSIVGCETELVVQLLLGMLIWLAKWVPAIENMTVDRLMSAIKAFAFHGLESRHASRSEPAPRSSSGRRRAAG